MPKHKESKRKMNLSRLSGEKKQRAWRKIKQTNPSLTALLQDGKFQSLRDHFNGDVLIDASELDTPVLESKTDGQH